MRRAAIDLVTGFIEAAQRGDVDAMRAHMTDGFIGHITTADGGVRTADREQYVAAIEAMDVRSAGLRLDVPNIVQIAHDRVLAMIEVHAERGGRTLHNHSGQLFTIDGDQVSEVWMVDALPEASDQFWAS